MAKKLTVVVERIEGISKKTNKPYAMNVYYVPLVLPDGTNLKCKVEFHVPTEQVLVESLVLPKIKEEN